MAETDNLSQNAAFRAALRRERIAARQALAPTLHRQHSAAIQAHLAELLKTHPPGTLAFCWPIRNEFDCRPLVQDLMARGWQACIPVVTAPRTAMAFRAWSMDTAMDTDIHGIPIPAGGEIHRPDVVLLPLVAFDAQGYRLGYGGGYFDRTLAAMHPRPLCIGVGFELARTTSTRPAEHDIPMDVVVTEAGAKTFTWR